MVLPKTTHDLDESSAPHASPPVVLVIDDDPLVSVVVRRALEGTPCQLKTAVDGETGLREAEAHPPDLIVLDNILPDGLGVDVLDKLHALAPDAPILFVTAWGSGSTAIEAMKGSAFDYLPKPLEPARLRAQIQRALSLRKLVSDRDAPDATGLVQAFQTAFAEESPPESDALVGECPAMQAVFKAIGKVAAQDVAVLIRGEHGSGKEAIARVIHHHSHRATGPFVKLHCPGLDEGRLEKELFGESGASGRIAEAAGGTLLLQEIGRLPLATQGRLLQAIRDGKYAANGAAAEATVECRFLAITTTDLEEVVRSGAFRSDLYYALSCFVIHLPPLRQRHGDLPLLIAHSLRKLSPLYKSLNVDQPRVSTEVMQALCRHLWPGNIDELESVLKRALVEQKGHLLLASELKQSMSEDPVVAAAGGVETSKHTTDWDVFTQLRIDSGVDTLHADAVAETEQKLFARVLRHTGGNQAHAARILGITRASLRKKLRLYGMSARQPDE